LKGKIESIQWIKNKKSIGKWSPNWDGPFHIKNVFLNNAYSIIEPTTARHIASINEKYLKQYKLSINEMKITT